MAAAACRRSAAEEAGRCSRHGPHHPPGRPRARLRPLGPGQRRQLDRLLPPGASRCCLGVEGSVSVTRSTSQAGVDGAGCEARRRRSPEEISDEIADLALRAQENRLQPGDVAGGKFTVTNAGRTGARCWPSRSSTPASRASNAGPTAVRQPSCQDPLLRPANVRRPPGDRLPAGASRPRWPACDRLPRPDPRGRRKPRASSSRRDSSRTSMTAPFSSIPSRPRCCQRPQRRWPGQVKLCAADADAPTSPRGASRGKDGRKPVPARKWLSLEQLPLAEVDGANG